MTPTIRHYLISFAAGLLMAVVGILAEQFTQHPDGNIDWRALGFAVLGGVILFARDWLRNNSNAFLENTLPGQVAINTEQKPLDTLPTPIQSPQPHG